MIVGLPGVASYRDAFVRFSRSVLMSRFSRSRHAALRAFGGALLVLSMLANASGLAFASGTTGTISGTITNAATGAPLTGVKVNIASPTGQASSVTNAKGFFSLTGLNVDTYVVSFEIQGFEPYSVTGVTVFPDQVQDVSAKLKKSLLTIATTSVRSANGAFQPKQTQDTYSVSSEQVETLLGRSDAINESNLLASLPGASFDSSGYPVLRGGRENEEGFQSEGIDQTDAFTSQFVNSLALNPSLKSLQLTPGAGDASTGNAGTGTINLTAKRGTYPGFGSIQGTMQSPDFDHELGVEYGIATKDGSVSNYISFQGVRNAGATYGRNADAREIGRFFSVTDGIDNDLVDNFVVKFGNKQNQSFQAYYENEIYTFLNSYGGYNDLYYKTNDPYYLDTMTSYTGLSNSQIQSLSSLLPYQPSATSLLGTRSPGAYYQPNYTFKLQYNNNLNASTFVAFKYYAVSSSTTFDFPFASQDTVVEPSYYLQQGGHRTGFAFDATKQFGSTNLVQLGAKYEILSPTYDQVDPGDGLSSVAFSPAGNIYDFVPVTACPAGVVSAGYTCGYLYGYLKNPGPTPYNDEQSSTLRQDYAAYITDTISPNDRLKIQAGLRLDGSHYKFGSYNSQFFAPATVDAAGYPLNAAGQEVTSDTGTYPTTLSSAETDPLVVEPRLSASWQLGPNDSVRASYGRSVELAPLGFVDWQQGTGQFARFASVPANSAVCGITGNLTCQNYADELYWINQNWLEGVPYQPAKPATFNNYDFSYSHEFPGNVGLKITPYYRRGYDALALVASPRRDAAGNILLNPDGTIVTGPSTTTNLGTSRTSGVEFYLTKEAPLGFSGSLSATYINETSNVIPNSPSEDFFPSIPPASLALGNQYRVGFLSPFQATLAVQYKSKGGIRINPQIYYTRGYTLGEGLYTATYVNGKPYNVANTNETDPNGPSVAQQYVDPQNPGTILNPNIDATRGTANAASAGGVIAFPSVYANITFEYSPPRTHSTFGLQILNIAGNVYSGFGGGNNVVSNTRYQPVATGISGPLSGYDLPSAQYPSLGTAYYWGSNQNGQGAYDVPPYYEGTQIQVYYKLAI
jgi:hypothetical protein